MFDYFTNCCLACHHPPHDGKCNLVIDTHGNGCECVHPDPVQALVDLFSNLPVDDETWREIVDEPYG